MFAIIQNLPSESKATSELRGPHRPNLTGVGDKPLSNGARSYSLSKSSGDNGSNRGTDDARASRGGTLNERNGGDEIGGGTLKARDGSRENPANKVKCAFAKEKEREREKKRFGSSVRNSSGKRTSDKEIRRQIVQRSHLKAEANCDTEEFYGRVFVFFFVQKHTYFDRPLEYIEINGSTGNEIYK